MNNSKHNGTNIKSLLGTYNPNRRSTKVFHPNDFKTIVRQNFRKDLVCLGSLSNNVFLDSKNYLGITRCYSNHYLLLKDEPHTIPSESDRPTTTTYLLKKLFKKIFLSHSYNIFGPRKLGRLVYCKTKYKKVAPALKRFSTKAAVRRSITNNLFRSGKNLSYAYFNVGYRSRVAKLLKKNLLSPRSPSLQGTAAAGQQQSPLLYLKNRRLSLLSRIVCNRTLIKSVFKY